MAVVLRSYAVLVQQKSRISLNYWIVGLFYEQQTGTQTGGQAAWRAPLETILIQSPPPAPSPFRCAPGLLPSSQSVSRLPPPLGCIEQQALSNQRLKEQGVPKLRLPCRDSGIQ
jgi:hypothetical protein